MRTDYTVISKPDRVNMRNTCSGSVSIRHLLPISESFCVDGSSDRFGSDITEGRAAAAGPPVPLAPIPAGRRAQRDPGAPRQRRQTRYLPILASPIWASRRTGSPARDPRRGPAPAPANPHPHPHSPRDRAAAAAVASAARSVFVGMGVCATGLEDGSPDGFAHLTASLT